MKIINIEQYCSEIDILGLLEPTPKINLLVAPTGSGKTHALMSLAKQNDFNLAFCSPLVAINEQVVANFPEFKIETGTKTQDVVSMGKHTITTFHSIPRLLELDNIDILVIDEIHSLTSLVNFASEILNPFWNTVQSLITKHPHMKVIAATGTPQIIRLYPHFNFNEIILKPKQMLGDKIGEIAIIRSAKTELNEGSYVCLYESRKRGMQMSDKYNGSFLDSANKNMNPHFLSIVQTGDFEADRLFTSTLLATGVNLYKPMDKLIALWGDIIDCLQFISRVRIGIDKVCLQSGVFWYERDGVEMPHIVWTKDFVRDMRTLSGIQSYFSYIIRQDAELYKTVIYTTLTCPEKDFESLILEYEGN